MNESFEESNRYSFIKGNYYNKTKDLLLIVYENRDIPNGIKDAFSPKAKLNFYCHIIDDKFNSVFDYDIALPERNIPFHFEDDLIYCYDIHDNKLKVNIYKIKDLGITAGK